MLREIAVEHMKKYLLLLLLASCALSEPATEPPIEGDAVLDPVEAEALADQAHEAEALTSEHVSALGADACRNTDITITNSYELDGLARPIRVHRVEFWSTSEGRWTSEDLANTSMEYGATLTWWNEDLAHAENDRITHWRVYFEYAEYIPGPELLFWSTLYYMEINTADQTCAEDSNFEMTVD